MFDQLAALPRFRARVIALSNLGCFLGLSYIWNARPPLYTTHYRKFSSFLTLFVRDSFATSTKK